MADFSPLQKIFAAQNGGSDRPQAGSRFGLSWPFLVALCLVLIGSVAWAFFMGYMVGKGENPGESLGVTAGASKSENTESPPVFFEPGVQAEPVPEQETASLPQQQPMVEAPHSAVQQRAQARPPASKPASAPKAAPQPKPASSTRYNYVFQIAAMRNANEAEALRKKLAVAKWRASTQKSGKVHLVLVSLRGTHEDVVKFQTSLKKIHGGKPLQISRKPVEAAKNTRSR